MIEQYIQDFPTWALWATTAFGMVLLVIGADRAVTGASRLAAVLGMSPVIIGATVVSLGTTSPEACVSVTAAFQGKGGLALGNGVGSIICDTALVFGLSCCLVRLPIDRFVLQRHGWLQLGSGVLLAVALGILAILSGGIDNVIMPRIVGIIFVACLIAYLAISVHWAKQHPESFETPDADGDGRSPWLKASIDLGLCAFGLALVIGGSDVLIGSVTEICKRLNVPDDILAVTVVAFGTSLPELATAIAAIVKGHMELLVGNVVGADILNVLFVIGASATAVELDVPRTFYTIHIPVMLAALVMLRIWIAMGMKKGRFSRWQGVPLLALYAGYFVILLNLPRG
jgi:cation:H+ antiporter